ncbi:hypothetical protein Taro_052854 [Colocasia esculenta]|uniref:Uncharacterized protein n=1 Tax=Colocasia esculenta TaxID=4460 RepID=A0A843XKX1_COLES|nr:hypothetical protein [Colocasia esculenta]
MVSGGRSGRGSTSFDAPSISVGRGVCLPADYAGCLGDRVSLPDYTGCPGDKVCLPYYAGSLGDMVCLPYYAGCPGDRVRLLPSSVTYPIPFNSRGREPSSRGRGGGSASWTPAMLDFWKVDVGGLGQDSEDHRQLGFYGLDGLRPHVDEEGLLGVPLSSLGYWTLAGKVTDG